MYAHQHNWFSMKTTSSVFACTQKRVNTVNAFVFHFIRTNWWILKNTSRTTCFLTKSMTIQILNQRDRRWPHRTNLETRLICAEMSLSRSLAISQLVLSLHMSEARSLQKWLKCGSLDKNKWNAPLTRATFPTFRITTSFDSLYDLLRHFNFISISCQRPIQKETNLKVQLRQASWHGLQTTI